MKSTDAISIVDMMHYVILSLDIYLAKVCDHCYDGAALISE